MISILNSFPNAGNLKKDNTWVNHLDQPISTLYPNAALYNLHTDLTAEFTLERNILRLNVCYHGYDLLLPHVLNQMYNYIHL